MFREFEGALSEIKSLARGLVILDYLGQAEQGVGITELAEKMGIDKGSASRLLATLANYGYAEKDSVTRRYRLGPQVVSLSRSVLLRMPLRETAKPYLRQLMESTGECAHLGVVAQGKVLYIDQVESPATLRVNAQVGHMSPLHCTALGKALLAFGDLQLPETLESYTVRTLTDPDILRMNLEQTRKQGYGLDDEEYDYGVRCVAVQVFDFREKVIGAIGISGPAARMTLEKMPEVARMVMEIGRALSDRMRFVR
jgi:IclR family transcriptional regulator, KDG regulon repressor